jgi:hypothetical protein
MNATTAAGGTAGGLIVADAVTDEGDEVDGGDGDSSEGFAERLAAEVGALPVILPATQDAPPSAAPATVMDLYQSWQALQQQRKHSDHRFGPGPLATTCLNIEVAAFRRFSEAVCSYPGVVQVSPCLGYRRANGDGRSMSIQEVPIGAAHMIPVPSMTNANNGTATK